MGRGLGDVDPRAMSADSWHPTAFALRKAQEANMAIYARSESGAVEIC